MSEAKKLAEQAMDQIATHWHQHRQNHTEEDWLGYKTILQAVIEEAVKSERQRCENIIAAYPLKEWEDDYRGRLIE